MNVSNQNIGYELTYINEDDTRENKATECSIVELDDSSINDENAEPLHLTVASDAAPTSWYHLCRLCRLARRDWLDRRAISGSTGPQRDTVSVLSRPWQHYTDSTPCRSTPITSIVLKFLVFSFLIFVSALISFEIYSSLGTGPKEDISGVAEQQEVCTYSVIQTCPRHKFETALRFLLDDEGLLKNPTPPVTFNNTVERYLRLARSRPNCPCSDRTLWPGTSPNPLIMDLGLGTSGTRWFNDIMRNRCYKTGHNLKKHKRSMFEHFAVVSDSPVPYLALSLLLSHPQGVAINTLRDPVDWIHSRLSGGHTHISMTKSRAPGPCGNTNNLLGRGTNEVHDRTRVVFNPDAAIDVMVFQAWITCIVPSDRLLTLNVFRNEDAEMLNKIDNFLEFHGLQKKDCKKPHTSSVHHHSQG